MAKYATLVALFALFAVALAATTVSKEAAVNQPQDLQTAPGIGLGYYGLGFGYPFHYGLYGRGLYGRGLYGGFGFYG